jgi:Flp pilus assembly protein TadG
MPVVSKWRKTMEYCEMQFSKRRPNSSHSSRVRVRGAAMPEFVIASIPVFAAFFSFMQLQQLYIAHLAMKHATLVAARAGTVMLEADHNPGATGGEADAIAAANAAIGPLKSRLTLTTKVSGSGSRNGMVTATVTGKYQCKVPLGGRIVCGIGGVKTLPEYSVSLPLQGAE